MSRIVKQVYSVRETVDPIALGADLELPDVGDGSQGNFGNEPEEPEELDPEALRQAVLEEARAEAEVKVQEAYAEGLSRGEQSGREAFDASIAEAASMLEAASKRIVEAREVFLDGLAPQVSALAVLIAERVLQRAVEDDPDQLNTTVHRALERLTDRQKVTLQVNPADLEAMRSHKIALLEEFSTIEELHIEPSDEVEAGGCMAISETMQADVSVRTLLADIVEHMYDE